MGTPKVKITKNFEQQLKRLRDAAQREVEAVRGGDVASYRWYRPVAEGDIDLKDLEQLGQPFDRSEANEQYLAALNPQDTGVVGDGILATLQVDYLAAMERAYRARHTMGRPRSMLHAMARRAGHADNRGPLIGGVLEYARNLVKQSGVKRPEMA